MIQDKISVNLGFGVQAAIKTWFHVDLNGREVPLRVCLRDLYTAVKWRLTCHRQSLYGNVGTMKQSPKAGRIGARFNLPLINSEVAFKPVETALLMPGSLSASSTRLNFLKKTALFLFWSLLFGLAFTQWPLYSENQNTKYLIGLAAGGRGYLHNDWLANTVDPLPVFTGLVYLTYRFLHQNLFYLYHGLLLGVYLYSLMGIACKVFDIGKTVAGYTFFSTFIIALHAGLLTPFSLPLMGTSVSWLLQSGVANQYLLNPVLQPSTFGVLLVLSIFLFLNEKPFWAAIAASTAALFHTTYLPSAGILVASYMLLLWWEKRSLAAPLTVGSIAFCAVLPVLLYNLLWLGPTSVDTWQRAQDLIVNFRIPHHSNPDLWLDRLAVVKLGLVLVGTLLVARSRLFWVMFLSLGAAVLLTCLQIVTNSNFLAFIAPWRISVFLVPLASVMIGAFVLSSVLKRWPLSAPRGEWLILSAVVLWMVLLVGKGVQAIQDSFETRRTSDAASLWRYGRETRQLGQTYLIPVYMAEFRLETGIPVVVTFKSHPYKDLEVIEWRSRIDAVNSFYANVSCPALREIVQRYRVTHVILERSQFFDGCSLIRNVHLDERFGVFEIVAEG